MSLKVAKEKKGITLIALVITIIILLILAGVTIATLTGDNGILKRAQDAKEKTEEAKIEEEKQLENMDDYINQYLNPQTVQIENVNLYNKEEMKVGYYDINGIEGTNEDYMVTGYISVNPNDVLYWTAYLPDYEKFDYELTTKSYLLQYAVYVSLYNNNKEFIETETAKKITFDYNNNNVPNGYIVPEGVSYIRLTLVTSYGRAELSNTLFVCKNEPPKYYAEYNETTAKINYSIYLPNELQIAEDTSFSIYNSNICPSKLYNENLRFVWECDIGTSNNDGITFTPTSQNIGNHNAKVSVYDNFDRLIATADTNIKIIAKNNSENRNTLLIGDSLSNGKPWINKVEELSENKINITAFAVSGASAYGYYTSDTLASSQANQFYNSELGHFDYKYYIDTKGTNFDSIILFLGTNDADFSVNKYPYINSETIKLKAIVDNIKEYNSDLPIYIITLMTKENDYFKTRTAFNFMKDFYHTFNDYKNVNIVPIELTIDSVNDFGDDKVHPLDSGYDKIADAVYSVFCANEGN